MARVLHFSNAWKIFLLILIVNILQSVFSPLLWDEPYYWVWSRYLSWGYFDHPPMIAFLIRMGTALFPHEIGVRIFCVILGCFTYYFTYRMMEEERDGPANVKLAALLLFSSLFLNLYTFLACPDTPLLFFVALFLFTYRRYLQNDSLLNTVVMGIVTALMLYAKYQGVLLIGFTVLSNIKLLRKRSFYLVSAIGAILLAPHIYWQILNDYPTIRFHLLERAKLDSWHDFYYLPKQLILTGPVILLLFSILYKPVNQFQKALKYNVIGVFFFFFVSSFHGLVNMHWTNVAWPAMLCLAYLYIMDVKFNTLYVRMLLILNLVCVLLLRVNFIFNLFKVLVYNDENPALMSTTFKAKAKGHPLVFQDMYNEPSFYMFYQHQEAYAVNTFLYKKSQYNYLNGLEKTVQGKTISLISESSVNSTSEKLSIPKGKSYYITVIPNFSSYNTDIEVKVIGVPSLKASVKDTVRLAVEGNMDSSGIKLLHHKNAFLQLNMISKNDGDTFSYKSLTPLDVSDKNSRIFIFKGPSKGNYRYMFSIVTDDRILGGINSNINTIEVK